MKNELEKQELIKLFNLFQIKIDKKDLKNEIFLYIQNQLLDKFDLASIKKFCEDFKNKFTFLPSYAEAKKFVDEFVFKFKPAALAPIVDKDIWDKVEERIADFLQSHKELCDKAKQEKWLGYSIKKCKIGLLGYMRTSFAIQYKILEKLDIPVPIYQTNEDIVGFFRSLWFKEITLQNGYVKPIYKNEHFELIK